MSYFMWFWTLLFRKDQIIFIHWLYTMIKFSFYSSRWCKIHNVLSFEHLWLDQRVINFSRTLQCYCNVRLLSCYVVCLFSVTGAQPGFIFGGTRRRSRRVRGADIKILRSSFAILCCSDHSQRHTACGTWNRHNFWSASGQHVCRAVRSASQSSVRNMAGCSRHPKDWSGRIDFSNVNAETYEAADVLSVIMTPTGTAPSPLTWMSEHGCLHHMQRWNPQSTLLLQNLQNELVSRVVSQ